MDQTNQAGSKKNLYIIVGVVVLLLIGGYMMRGPRGMMGVPVPDGVDVNRNMDGSATYKSEDGTVTIGGNKLPDNWPSDAPTYNNATISYSGSSNPKTGEAGMGLVFTTSDSSQTVVNFYKSELAAKGWTVEQTATMGASTVLAAKKDSRTFGVYIADAGTGQVTVTVGIEGAE